VDFFLRFFSDGLHFGAQKVARRFIILRTHKTTAVILGLLPLALLGQFYAMALHSVLLLGRRPRFGEDPDTWAFGAQLCRRDEHLPFDAGRFRDRRVEFLVVASARGVDLARVLLFLFGTVVLLAVVRLGPGGFVYWFRD